MLILIFFWISNIRDFLMKSSSNPSLKSKARWSTQKQNCLCNVRVFWKFAQGTPSTCYRCFSNNTTSAHVKQSQHLLIMSLHAYVEYENQDRAQIKLGRNSSSRQVKLQYDCMCNELKKKTVQFSFQGYGLSWLCLIRCAKSFCFRLEKKKRTKKKK